MFRAGPVVEVKELAERLAAVAGSDLTRLTEGEVTELVVESHRALAIAEAVHTAAVARLDVTRAFEPEGARSAASWVAWKCRIPAGRAHGTAKCGRALRSMPVTEAAFLAGQLTSAHVRVLARAQKLAPELFAEHEAYLVEQSQTLRFSHFERVIRYWCHRAAPDDVEDEALTRYESRTAHCSTTFENMVAINAMLEPVGGQIYARELARLEQQMFEADWAEARGRLGERALPGDLCRTAAQRRADAMVEMARRSAAMLPGAKEARPLLSVFIGEGTLARICELSNGAVVTPGEVLPLLRDADIERIVFDGPSRVLDVGVRQRLFTGATRRAVEVRDRQCAHPSCDIPAERCEVDHDVPYPQGGLTVQDNGTCRCPFHHRWRHRQDPPPS
ncbi:MAG: endonuclease [Acidimicrobiales bacterium]|nr:endonuclease [Acidimicrobiales bacterium]